MKKEREKKKSVLALNVCSALSYKLLSQWCERARAGIQIHLLCFHINVGMTLGSLSCKFGKSYSRWESITLPTLGFKPYAADNNCWYATNPFPRHAYRQNSLLASFDAEPKGHFLDKAVRVWHVCSHFFCDVSHLPNLFNEKKTFQTFDCDVLG